MRPYVRPVARVCDFCGVPVIYEFGVLDAASYADGLVRHHICAPLRTAPLNQREWEALQPAAEPPEDDAVDTARRWLLARQAPATLGDQWAR